MQCNQPDWLANVNISRTSRFHQKKIMNDFGKKLADFRKAKGLTQKELGEKIGVSNRVTH